jgi:hypothetical protein
VLSADDGSTPMRDVPLGTLIFRAGLLAEEQLEDALQEGMRTGKRLGEVLLERGWLHERDLGRLLAGQKGLPFVEIRASDAEPSALELLPEEKARMQTALPLRHEGDQLVVAVADPSNELVLENLRRSLGSEPKLVVAPHGELIRAIGEAYTGTADPTPAEPEPVPEPVLTPEPPVHPESTLMEEQAPMSEPIVVPEPMPQPEQPAAPVAVTPLPTVLPPQEVREAQPAPAPPLEPPAAVPAAEAFPQPSTIEPMTLTSPPAEEAPAPALEPAALPAEPVMPPQAVAPLAPPPPAEAPPVSPDPAIEPAPIQPPIEVVQPEPAPEPFLAPPAAVQPVDPPSAPAQVVPTAPVPPPVEAPPAAQDPGVHASLHIVSLRLRDGETLEIGTFPSAAEASVRAQEVVRQIAAAESDASWPFFAERYLRPDTIVSVDLVEETPDKWLGSAARTRWASQSA